MFFSRTLRRRGKHEANAPDLSGQPNYAERWKNEHSAREESTENLIDQSRDSMSRTVKRQVTETKKKNSTAKRPDRYALGSYI